MAFLRQLVFQSSEAVDLPKERRQHLRCIAHHVSELLEHFLGSRYELDGSSKLTVLAGPIPDSDREYLNVLGTSALYLPEFNVEQCLDQPPTQSQEEILDAYVEATRRILALTGLNRPGLEEAARLVRESRFSQEQEIKKLSRSTPDRQVRVRVFRCLSHERGEAWEARIEWRDGSWLGTELITSDPSYLDRTTHFAASRWSGLLYEIFEPRLDRVYFTLDCEKYLGNAV